MGEILDNIDSTNLNPINIWFSDSSLHVWLNISHFVVWLEIRNSQTFTFCSVKHKTKSNQFISRYEIYSRLKEIYALTHWELRGSIFIYQEFCNITMLVHPVCIVFTFIMDSDNSNPQGHSRSSSITDAIQCWNVRTSSCHIIIIITVTDLSFIIIFIFQYQHYCTEQIWRLLWRWWLRTWPSCWSLVIASSYFLDNQWQPPWSWHHLCLVLNLFFVSLQWYPRK